MKNLLLLTLFFMSTIVQAQESHTIKLTQRMRYMAEDLVFSATVSITPAYSYGFFACFGSHDMVAGFVADILEDGEDIRVE